ncbi:MAG: phosphotransferase [Acidimicrobiia bacterium]|nr:phosphotransferase [Acidimicrobiia bacterium]
MRPWNTLTEAGQIRRLRPLAMAALDRFAVIPTRLRLVGGFTNVLFRVDTADGAYAMRVDLHQDHSDTDVQIELGWLAALAAETDLDVAVSVPAIDGSPFVNVGAPGVPGERRCTLFEWIPGKPIGDDPTPEHYHRLGQLSARLHEHGATYRPGVKPMQWDRIFYWPEEVDPVVIDKPEMAQHFSGDRRQILDRCIEVVGGAFDRLDPAGAQIVHADLHPWNVHVYRSRMVALDFEDVAMAHRVQDIAITLYYQRDHDAYTEFVAAFTAGYREIQPWPETYPGEVDHFVAARGLMFVNYVLNLLDDPSDFYATLFPRLRAFLEKHDT